MSVLVILVERVRGLVERMKGSVEAVEAEGLSQSQPSIYRKESRLTRRLFCPSHLGWMKGSVEAVEAEWPSQSQSVV